MRLKGNGSLFDGGHTRMAKGVGTRSQGGMAGIIDRRGTNAVRGKSGGHATRHAKWRRRVETTTTTTTTTKRGRVGGRAALRTGRPERSPLAPASVAGSGNQGHLSPTKTPGAKVDAFLLGVADHWVVKRVSSALAKLGLTREAARKQFGHFSMAASVTGLTSKFCVYDPTPTTPVDTFILLCKALANFLAFYTLILFVRVLLTWFPNIDWDKNPWLTLRQITDPYLNIFRNLVPPLMGQIDLTPIVGFLVMQYITSFIKFLGNRFISIDNFSDGWGGVFFFEDEDMLAGLFEDQNAAPTAPPA